MSFKSVGCYKQFMSNVLVCIVQLFKMHFLLVVINKVFVLPHNVSLELLLIKFIAVKVMCGSACKHTRLW